MATVIIFFIFLLALLYATCSENACVGNWSTEITKYRILNFKEDSFVHVSCKYKHFKVDGKDLIKCVHGQLPAYLPQCVRIQASCQHLKAPTYGSMKCSATAPEIGSSCSFECQGSHYRRGSATRYCTGDLRWTGSAAHCLPKPECSEPPPLLQGSVTGCSPEKKPRYNDTCNFRCNEGFQLHGPSYVVCRRDGRLTDKDGHQNFPTCLRALPQNASDVDSPGNEDTRNRVKQVSPTSWLSCEVHNGFCSHYCDEKPNGIQCSCRDGYRLSQNGRTCIDIDECNNQRLNHCDHTCRNTAGSYICVCNKGYFSPDGFKCEETFPGNPVRTFSTDEQNLRNRPPPVHPTIRLSCQVENGYCSHHCHEEATGVRCSCDSGYELSRDGRTCVDIDECVDESLNKCDHTCRNTAGSYACLCRYGYSSPDGFKCEDRRNRPPPVHPTFRLSCQVENGHCSHHCHEEATGIRCSCDSGYELSRDGRTCVDIDECRNQRLNKCDHTCRNTAGSYKCLCRTGYSSPDGLRCEDINECLNDSLNKCEHNCQNTEGGYNCFCKAGFVSSDGFRCEGCRVNSYRSSLDVSCRDCPADSHTEGEKKTSIDECICNQGFTGNPGQGIPCRDIDECNDGKKFGCSHICINTPGSAHCACPLGYQLKEDEKTCTDIDECSIKNGGCDGICHNTIGNFTCSCSEGYVASPDDRYSCDDVNECLEENGGCSGECVNFKGGFHCFCREGYHLHLDGKSCIPVYCPRVSVPHHSTLRCRKSKDSGKVIYRPREMSEDEEFPVGTSCKLKCDKGYDLRSSDNEIICQNDGKWNASLTECQVLQCPPLTPPTNGDVYPPSCKEGSSVVKQKCVFTCHPGYRIKGQEVFVCRNNLTWSRKKQTQCVPETEVSISCPDDDITIELMSNESWAEIQLNSPRTTMAEGPIRVNPAWVSLDRVTEFPAGETEVIFSVTGGNKVAECSIFVIVQDKHPPVFPDCPDTLSVTSTLGIAEVHWEEPVPEDNVGIASVTKSMEPNTALNSGIHFVEYIARDYAGNIGQCIFQINVTVVGCKDLADPENGEANCMEWSFGKICQPTCFDNYTHPDELFACDESGTWTPTDFISPCLPECLKDETWSTDLQKCVQII